MKQDFDFFVKNIMKELYRAVIIHYENTKSLREFSEKVVQVFNGKYLNLIDYFNKNIEWAKEINTFDLEKLKTLLVENSKNTSFLIVDNIEFILDTWLTQQRENYYRFIKNQWNSYIETMRTPLMFCMKTNIDFSDLEISGINGESRIYSLSTFNAP